MKLLLVLAATVFLTHCSGRDADTSGDTAVTGARSATEWTLRAAHSTMEFTTIRPSALLGTFITEYLVHTSVFRGAIAGIQAQMQILFDDEFEEDESFALLEDLGSLLQVDVMDMLNRSTNRPAAFDIYMDNLVDLGTRGEGHLERLEQQLDEVQDARRLQRREAARIQRALNESIRGQDYASASGLQRQVIEAETELSRIESEEDERRNVIRLFEKLLKIADERLVAMRQNRALLIAGLRVVEVPGIEDLGILEEGMRRRRESPFGDVLSNPNF